MNSMLDVGVIQTTLDYKAAWVDDESGDWKRCVQMSSLEEKRAKKEIRHYLATLRGLDRRPDIILLPELSVPTGFEYKLKRAAEKLESIIIAGVDYQIKSTLSPTVSNEAVVIVPKRLKGKKIAAYTDIRRIGKTYAAPAEAVKLSRITGGPVTFQPHPTVWVFESEDLGKFAVAVCYDFLDLDRIAMYRNKIQTLFILAYNQDTNCFDHMAEAIAQTVFCNVVVCNCAYFGGSIAVSPFRDSFKRIVYKHSGQHLPHAQLIQLPLESLKAIQIGAPDSDKKFKSRPPGFSTLETLTAKTKAI